MSRPNRRRAVRAVAPVAGLLAAGLLVWQGSYAAFSATTTSPGNSWGAGTVSLLNSTNAFAGATGSAVWSAASNLKPGSTDTKCVTVKSDGSLAGAVKFYLTGLTQTKALADNINVTVKVMDTGVTASNVNSSTCSGFTATSTLINNVAMSTVAAAASDYAGSSWSGWSVTGTGPTTPEYAAYQISWTVNSSAPNSVQGGTAGATFNWEVQA